MARYRIVSAHPKGAANHLKSQFKVYKYSEKDKNWDSDGWKSIHEISDLIRDGHDVATGEINGDKISGGAKVEIELRIAKNEEKFKISDMPSN